mgnify:CR=1 FL=1
MKIGILPLGRPTFDVDFANQKLSAMLAVLDASDHAVMGPRALLFDEAATRAAMSELAAEGVDQILILQVTFTDASMAVAIGAAFPLPLSIWSIPEPSSCSRAAKVCRRSSCSACMAPGIGREASYSRACACV